MNFEIKDQLMYIITTEDYDYKEYYIPLSWYKEYHIEAYGRFLDVYPEFNMINQFTIDRYLPEELREYGMVVYNGFGRNLEKYRENYYGFEYSGGLLLPKDIKTIQREKLISKLNELKKIYLEISYYEQDEIKFICDNIRKDPEYTAYEKLKTIIHK